MANAIVVLANSDDRVICNLQEVREDDKEDGRPVCLIMVRPYILNLESAPKDAPGGQEVQVRFNKWLPYSIDTQFKIPFSSVLAVGQVDPGLDEAYNRTVAQAEAQEAELADTIRSVSDTPAADTGFVPSEEGADAETTAV